MTDDDASSSTTAASATALAMASARACPAVDTQYVSGEDYVFCKLASGFTLDGSARTVNATAFCHSSHCLSVAGALHRTNGTAACAAILPGMEAIMENSYAGGGGDGDAVAVRAINCSSVAPKSVDALTFTPVLPVGAYQGCTPAMRNAIPPKRYRACFRKTGFVLRPTVRDPPMNATRFCRNSDCQSVVDALYKRGGQRCLLASSLQDTNLLTRANANATNATNANTTNSANANDDDTNVVVNCSSVPKARHFDQLPTQDFGACLSSMRAAVATQTYRVCRYRSQFTFDGSTSAKTDAFCRAPICRNLVDQLQRHNGSICLNTKGMKSILTIHKDKDKDKDKNQDKNQLVPISATVQCAKVANALDFTTLPSGSYGDACAPAHRANVAANAYRKCHAASKFAFDAPMDAQIDTAAFCTEVACLQVVDMLQRTHGTMCLNVGNMRDILTLSKEEEEDGTSTRWRADVNCGARTLIDFTPLPMGDFGQCTQHRRRKMAARYYRGCRRATGFRFDGSGGNGANTDRFCGDTNCQFMYDALVAANGSQCVHDAAGFRHGTLTLLATNNADVDVGGSGGVGVDRHSGDDNEEDGSADGWWPDETPGSGLGPANSDDDDDGSTLSGQRWCSFQVVTAASDPDSTRARLGDGEATSPGLMGVVIVGAVALLLIVVVVAHRLWTRRQRAIRTGTDRGVDPDTGLAQPPLPPNSIPKTSKMGSTTAHYQLNHGNNANTNTNANAVVTSMPPGGGVKALEAAKHPLAGLMQGFPAAFLLSSATSLAATVSGSSSRGGDGGVDAAHVLAAVRIPFEKLQFQELLSRGACGEVYSGVYREQRVAIKTLPREQRLNLTQIERLMSEAQLLARLEHDRVVQLVGVAGDSLHELCIVTELMPRGDLRTVLAAFGGQGDGSQELARPLGFDTDKLRIAAQMALALAFLHSLRPGVVHRDLKSRNVLLDDALNAKLADFGVARELAEDDDVAAFGGGHRGSACDSDMDSTMDELLTAGVGSALWMAPEVMTGERYGTKADVFSFGVLLSELDTHDLPYAHVTEPGSSRRLPDAIVVQRVVSGGVQVAFSAQDPAATDDKEEERVDALMAALGRQCVAVAPAERPTTSELLHRVLKIQQRAAASERLNT